MNQQSKDLFYLFVQRLFDATSSRELISKLLDTGYDTWEAVSALTEDQLTQLGLEQFKVDFQNVIQSMGEVDQHQLQEGNNPLTIAIMMRGVNKKKDYSKKQPKYGLSKEQIHKETLQTVNTLTINNQSLTSLSECINFCYNIQVLHIYENQITSLRHIEGLYQLRILYAQDNKIFDADAIQGLPRLEKIYLDKNCLVSCPLLPQSTDTLSISNQDISGNFIFTEEALEPCGGRLQHLICENNKVTEIMALNRLCVAKTVNLKNNSIKNFEDLEDAIVGMSSLNDLDLRGNPICQTPKYRDRVVLLSRSIECLDFKNILQHERQFLINLGKQKIIKRNQSLEGTGRQAQQMQAAVQQQSQGPPKKQSKIALAIAMQKTRIEGQEKIIHYENPQTGINTGKNFFEGKSTQMTKHIPRPNRK